MTEVAAFGETYARVSDPTGKTGVVVGLNRRGVRLSGDLHGFYSHKEFLHTFVMITSEGPVPKPGDLPAEVRVIHPPKGGWKPRTYYAVDVAMRKSNPIHRSVFYSGFLSDDGSPAGYNQVWNPSYEREDIDITSLHYLRVIRALPVED